VHREGMLYVAMQAPGSATEGEVGGKLMGGVCVMWHQGSTAAAPVTEPFLQFSVARSGIAVARVDVVPGCCTHPTLKYQSAASPLK